MPVEEKGEGRIHVGPIDRLKREKPGFLEQDFFGEIGERGYFGILQERKWRRKVKNIKGFSGCVAAREEINGLADQYIEKMVEAGGDAEKELTAGSQFAAGVQGVRSRFNRGTTGRTKLDRFWGSLVREREERLKAAGSSGEPPKESPVSLEKGRPEEEEWGEYGLKQPREFTSYQEMANYLIAQVDRFASEDKRFNRFIERALSNYIAHARSLAEEEGKGNPEALQNYQHVLFPEYKLKTGFNAFWYDAWNSPEKGVRGGFDSLVGLGGNLPGGALATCLSSRERALAFHIPLSSQEAIDGGFVGSQYKKGKSTIEARARLLDRHHAIKFRVKPKGMKEGVWNCRDPEGIYGHILQRITLATMNLPYKKVVVKDNEGNPLLVWNEKKKRYVSYKIKPAVTIDYEAGRNDSPFAYMQESYPEMYRWRFDLLEPVFKKVEVGNRKQEVVVDYINHADVFFFDFWHSGQMINFWAANYGLIGKENQKALNWDVAWLKGLGEREGKIKQALERDRLRLSPERPDTTSLDDEKRAEAEIDWARERAEWWREMQGMGRVTEDWLASHGWESFFSDLLARVYQGVSPAELNELRNTLTEVNERGELKGMFRVDFYALVVSHFADLRADYMKSLQNLNIHAMADPELRGKKDGPIDYFLDWSNPEWKERWDLSSFPAELSSFYKQQHYMKTTMRDKILTYSSTPEFAERQKILKEMTSELGCRHLGRKEWGPLRQEVLAFFYDRQSAILQYSAWRRRKTGERNSLTKDINMWRLFGLDRGFSLEHDFKPLEIPTVWSEMRSPMDLKQNQKAALVFNRFDLPQIFEVGIAREKGIVKEGTREITGKIGDFPGFEAMLAVAGLKVIDYYQTEETVGMYLETVDVIQKDGSIKKTEVARPKKIKVWRAEIDLDKLGTWRRERIAADSQMKDRIQLIQQQMGSMLSSWYDFMEPKDRQKIICQWINAYFHQTFDQDPKTYVERRWGPTRDDWVRQGGDMIWQEKDAEPRFGLWHVYNWRKGGIGPGKKKYIVDQLLTAEIAVRNKEGKRDKIEIMVLDDHDLPMWNERSGFDRTETIVRGSGYLYPGFRQRLTPLSDFYDEDFYMHTYPPIWEASFWQEAGETIPINWYDGHLARMVINPKKRAAQPPEPGEPAGLLYYLGQVGTLDPEAVFEWATRWHCTKVEVSRFTGALAAHMMPDVEGHIRTDRLAVDVQKAIGMVESTVPSKTVGIVAKLVPWGRTSQEIQGQLKYAAVNFAVPVILSALTAVNPGLGTVARTAWMIAVPGTLGEFYLLKDTEKGFTEKTGAFKRLLHYGLDLDSVPLLGRLTARLRKIPVLSRLIPKKVPFTGMGIGGRKHHVSSPKMLRYGVENVNDDGVPAEAFGKAFFEECKILHGRPTRMEYSF